MTIGRARPCPACRETGAPAWGSAGGFDLCRCAACATVFTDRLPEPAESLDYDGYYHEGNLEVPPFVHQRLDELVATFEPRRRANRWLDVGCGAGALMEAARSRGWEVVGTEVAA